ncbi:MAG: thioredoxin family protein [Chloroflexota bacterium]
MAKPIVDGLEQEVSDRGVVVRLNVGDEAGRAVASRYGLSAVPTFLVIRDGNEPSARFVGRPDHDRLVQAMFAPK